jgi:hypothetical protein
MIGIEMNDRTNHKFYLEHNILLSLLVKTPTNRNIDFTDIPIRKFPFLDWGDQVIALLMPFQSIPQPESAPGRHLQEKRKEIEN